MILTQLRVAGFAKAASIDAIRVDVFVWPGHPERASINEISLTSGAMYRCVPCTGGDLSCQSNLFAGGISSSWQQFGLKVTLLV